MTTEADETEFSVSAIGLISPDISEWISDHRASNKDWFALIEKLNRLGQKIFLNTRHLEKREISNSEILAILLLIRTLSNAQGAILMAERGMVIEARTLTRCCLENTFFLAALAKGEEECVKDMLHIEIDSQKKTVNWLLNRPHTTHSIDIEAEKRFKAYLQSIEQEWGKLSPVHFEGAAKKGGVDDLYLHYRVLSGDSAHPSLNALSQYVELAPGSKKIAEIKWGPDFNPLAIPDTLGHICLALIGACVAFTELLKDLENNQAVAVLANEYKKLSNFD